VVGVDRVVELLSRAIGEMCLDFAHEILQDGVELGVGIWNGFPSYDDIASKSVLFAMGT
jgi:hypothetical protein